MLRWVVFDTTMFADKDDAARTQKNVMWLLEALTQRNQEYLKQRPNTQRLYRSGVRYMTPQQFAGDVNEVAVLKTALGKTAKQPGVKRALDTVQDVLGGERFRDIGRIIENGGGDCFPLNTQFLRRTESGANSVSGSDLRCGDWIWGRGRWSQIRAVVPKGELSLDGIHLEGDRDFLLTRGHKIFVVDSSGTVRRVTVGQLEVGMDMIAPRDSLEWGSGHTRTTYIQKWSNGEEAWVPLDLSQERRVRVLGVDRSVATLPCIDIETDDHTVYLPVENLYVSQCDNLSCWRAAELRQAGIKAAPYMTSRTRLDGGTTYHALVVWPSLRELVLDGVLTENAIRDRSDVNFQTTEDPSLLLGMGGDRRSYDRSEELRKNQERCDLLRASAVDAAAPRATVAAVDALADDVLGLRRGGRGVPGASAALAELDALFRRAT